MRLFALFSRQAPNRIFVAMLLGGLAGISYAGLIPIVLASMQPGSGSARPEDAQVHTFLWLEVSNYKFATLFAAICMVILLARWCSQLMLARVAQEATTDLRLRIYRAVMRAPIADVERVGPSALMSALTTDVARIVAGATVVPNILVASVTVIGMLGYLFLLSTRVFWFVAGAILFGIITYQIPMIVGRRYFRRGRLMVDALMESIRGLLYGAKELRLNAIKRETFFTDALLADERRVLKNSRRAETIVTFAANYGALLSFFVVGFVTFIFISYHSMSSEKLVGVVMVLLYITGPVSLILNSSPAIAMASVSLRSVERLFGRLGTENASSAIQSLPPWQTLHLRGVSFGYGDAAISFELGPVDLDIHRGEVTFIVGGNGSGKSTLCKLMALHYSPAHGSIHFGDRKVDPEWLNSCRQSICAIFTDYYLFDRMLCDPRDIDEMRVNHYLAAFDLAKKVSVSNGRFSTTSLSDGQRKRLALLVAMLENRDVYIFDEWAADQDPSFKDVFYRQILPALKLRNKAVIVISHDDRYFEVADHLVFMEDGQLIRTSRKERADAAFG